jgi:DNA-directed RNA polymerase subunit RPC12/RpoP
MSMAIEAQCGCGARYQVAEEHAGREIRCSKCRQGFMVKESLPVGAVVLDEMISMPSLRDKPWIDGAVVALPPKKEAKERGCYGVERALLRLLLYVFAAFSGLTMYGHTVRGTGADMTPSAVILMGSVATLAATAPKQRPCTL